MIIEEGIVDEVRRENVAGLRKDTRTENKGIGEEVIVATRGAKEKQNTSICLTDYLQTLAKTTAQ